jgi:hypothetical protein
VKRTHARYRRYCPYCLCCWSRGFSTIEVVAATALTLAIAATIVALVEPSRDSFDAQPEATDMQQRLRVAAGALYNDLVMAGAGPYQGRTKGSLAFYFASIRPYRFGTDRDDRVGTFKSDTITVMYVPPTMAQTTVAAIARDGASANVALESGPGCPLGEAGCGFKAGTRALLLEPGGVHDPVTVAEAGADSVRVVRAAGRLADGAYSPGSTTLVEIVTNAYYLKRDVSTGIDQLMFANGGAGADRPLVDHVVGLRFAYYGDPEPPMLNGRPLADAIGPWTTYGPAPPELLRRISTAGYPAGENCTFFVDAISGKQTPRLSILGDPGRLVPLTAAELTDGPWCPDEASADRWDADLLRIRKVRVNLRVEAALATLRGPAGILFTHGGTSRSGRRWLPDQEVVFEVSPRNLFPWPSC